MPQRSVIIEIRSLLLFTLYNTENTAYHIMEALIFYADKIMVMGNSKNLREIYMFCSMAGILTASPMTN